jgi:uncharacterized protein YjbI with pentapeptide repeats
MPIRPGLLRLSLVGPVACDPLEFEPTPPPLALLGRHAPSTLCIAGTPWSVPARKMRRPWAVQSVDDSHAHVHRTTSGGKQVGGSILMSEFVRSLIIIIQRHIDAGRQQDNTTTAGSTVFVGCTARNSRTVYQNISYLPPLRWQGSFTVATFDSRSGRFSARDYIRSRKGALVPCQSHPFGLLLQDLHMKARTILKPGLDLRRLNMTGRDMSNRSLIRADFTGSCLVGADLSDADLSDAIFFGADLRDAKFDRAILVRADLRGATIRGASLTDADLTGADLREGSLLVPHKGGLVPSWVERKTDASHATMYRATLRKAKMGKLVARQTDLRDANMSGCILTGADLRDSTLTGCNLSGADLRGAVLDGCNLEGARMFNADLGDASLIGVVLTGALTDGVNFEGANLRSTVRARDLEGGPAALQRIIALHTTWFYSDGKEGLRADLSDLRLEDADMSGAILVMANLSRSVLRGTNLSSANLVMADMSGIDGRNINLASADLRGSSFQRANLHDAIMTGIAAESILRSRPDTPPVKTDFSRAHMCGANLAGADMSDAKLVGSDLSRCNLSGAIMRRTDLSGAILTGADTTGMNTEEAAVSRAVGFVQRLSVAA